MVGLAIVDMTFLLSAVISRPSVRNTGALRGLMPLLLFMSVMLLATRAVDRFNIFIRKQAKPWSLRFQIVVCLVSNIFVTVPITYSHLYTDIPFGLIFWCIVSLIIMVSYSTIVCKLLLKARKYRIKINPTQPSRLLRRHIAKGQSSMGTATDETAGTSRMNETEMTFVEKLQIPNTAMNKHSSVRRDHVIKEKTLDQMTNQAVIPAETRTEMRKEHEVLDKATTSNQIGKENKELEVAIATTGNHIGNESGEVAIATTGNQIGKEKNVLPVQKSKKFGKKKIGVRLEVGQYSAHMGKDKRTEVPIHVNRNQRLITKRNKGNHIRGASLALVFITIIFYLSWFPTWLIDIWDGAPCYLLMFIYVNNIGNPFVYLITLKAFRQASYHLISRLFCRICKSN